MIAEAAAAYESIKAASTIVRGLNSLNTQAEVNQAVIDLQQHLLDTQHTVMQLQDKVQELKAQIADLERFSPEKYELVDLVYNGHRFSGRKVQVEKATGTYYCPGCFAASKLTPVQFSSEGTSAYKCKSCDTNLSYADDHRLISIHLSSPGANCSSSRWGAFALLSSLSSAIRNPL